MVLIAIGLIANSCFKDGILNLTNGLALSVNAQLLPSPIIVSFLNPEPGVSNVPDHIFLDFFGEGAQDLFTPTGGSNIVVVDGLVAIGIKNGLKPTANKPLKFGMRVDAPGFYPNTYFVSLSNPDIPQHITLYLVEEGSMPSGVSDKIETHQLPSTGFTVAETLETPLENGKKEKVKAEIEAGTQLFSSANALVLGDVQVTLVHYDNRSNISLRAISGITESVPAVAGDGSDLGLTSFYTASLFSLEMNAGLVRADHFSKSVHITMILNPETFNPETGEFIAAGDELSLWRFDEEGNHWQGEGRAVVEVLSGKLAVRFDLTRAGTWMAGQAANLCGVGATIAIHSGIPESACARNFYTTLVDINTGKPLSSKWSDSYVLMEKNSRITLTDVPQGAVAKLQVWEGVRGCEGQLLGESQPFQACSPGEIQLDLSELNAGGWLPVAFSLAGYCEVKGTNVTIKPTHSMMYRPAGCGVYGLLGEFSEGEGCIATLRPGVIYDFKTRLGEEVFEFNDIPLVDGVINYTLPGGATAVIRVETDPGAAELTIEGLPLPEDICNLIE